MSSSLNGTKPNISGESLTDQVDKDGISAVQHRLLQAFGVASICEDDMSPFLFLTKYSLMKTDRTYGLLKFWAFNKEIMFTKLMISTETSKEIFFR
jgi:hypothetical protein